MHPPSYRRADVVSKEELVFAFQLLGFIVNSLWEQIVTNLLQFCSVITGDLLPKKKSELR